jgi:predicted RND superfamily exporter protein
MEQFWRSAGFSLGKYWYLVVAAVLVITGVLSFGARQIEFATGQDSYLNPESQIAIDNVEFQDAFGGETVILLFTATSPESYVSDLFEGENLATLDRITAELGEVAEAYSVITPLTSLRYSSELLTGGAGSGALLNAASRDAAGEAGAARQADVNIALARLGSVEVEEIGNPVFNELLLFGNDGYRVDNGEVVPPAPQEREIRLSLASSFPNLQTAVGGVVLEGNASLDEQSAGTEKVLEILDGVTFDGFELTVTGSPVYLKEINDYLQGGMLTLGLAALIVMMVVLGLMFRVRWRLLPLLAVVVGVAWSFSFLGLIGINLSLVTISGLPILIGLGIDFAIQIHNRVEEEVVLDRNPRPISESLANLAPPLIAAVITAVAAFFALQISKVPMIRDFGVLLSIGVLMLLIVGIVVTVSALGTREYIVPTKHRGESRVERVVVWLGGVPRRFALPMIVASVLLFIGGVLVEGRILIQSDPVRWIDQGSQTVADIDTLEEATGFGTTLGVLVSANNVLDQPVVDLVWDFTLDAESREDGLVVSSSSLVNTMGKIIKVDGANPIPPTSADVVAAVRVMSDDVALALMGVDAERARAVVESEDPREAFTQTQVNLRIAPSSLEQRAVLVADLEANLDRRIAALEIPADSVLLVDLPAEQSPVRAVPAGLATVGIGLLENLSANRAALTYLSLSLAGLFLVLRYRSLGRALIAMVPVFLAVGVSSLVIGFSGIELSPLTTVSGPLVIATCSEFSVLIMGRYLEERQRGLSAAEACDRAASRTGRAFFTSAVTTIGGFAVLIGSALPLLRDFGIVVTLNVAIALLAALVVMPPLMVWADERRYLGTSEQISARSVRLAAPLPGSQTPMALVGVGVFAAGAIATYASADTVTGVASTVSYSPVALTTTTTTTTTTIAPPPPDPDAEPADPDAPVVDPGGFGTDRPTGLVGGILFDALVDQNVAPNVANCTVETLLSRVSEEELLALGIAAFTEEAVAPVIQAAQDCGIDDETIDATLAAVSGG